MNCMLQDLSYKINSLALFHQLYRQPLFNTLKHLLTKSQEENRMDKIESLTKFASYIYESGGNLSRNLFMLCMEDENAYVLKRAKKEVVDETMQESVERELKILEACSKIDLHALVGYLGLEADEAYLPSWQIQDYDFVGEYAYRMDNIEKYGYGMFAQHHMFHLTQNGIEPIRYPDKQRLCDLHDYERERNLILKNTLVLLSGGIASNALLYGDAGTGKSSTIKAIANDYKDEGLRLIEIKKQQLFEIPKVIEKLSANPLKFILFIDDLSFSSEDENFATLKSILEGGISALGKNIVIYATSNRRHLVREDAKSREGDDLHLNDTLQETMSLSSRFALTITFQKPSKDVYLHIVHELSKQYGIDIEETELDLLAERFAIRHNGRSPRAAKQFIELLKAETQESEGHV